MKLGIDGFLEESTFESTSSKLSLDSRVDSETVKKFLLVERQDSPVPHSGYTGHELWFDQLSVFEKTCSISRGVSDGTTSVHYKDLQESLGKVSLES